MSHIIRDSFDFYSAVADAGQNYWDMVSTAAQFTLSNVTRFGVGQSMAWTGTSGIGLLAKVYATNEATNFVAFSLNISATFTTTALGFGLRWIDGATVQCSLYWLGDGSIRFYRGDGTSGTLLATFTSAWSVAAWTQYQVQVIISSTVGEVHIRKNGNTADDFAATGLNNRSTANNYANKMDLGNFNSSTSAWNLDDIWVFSGNAGGTPNTWIGDVRAVQCMPNSDSSIQFTRNSNNVAIAQALTGNSVGVSANTQQTISVFQGRSGTLGSASLTFQSASTGHAVMGIFDGTGSGGGPGALIATSNVVTNPVIGANTFTFATPPTLTNGATYYVALLGDVTLNIVLGPSSMNLMTSYTRSQTYGSGYSNPFSATGSTSFRPATLTLNITVAANYASVNELEQDGAISYVGDSVVGDKDLYATTGLSTTPSSILGVSLRGFVAKSDAGARSGQMTMTSGATALDGPALVLSTTFQNLVMVQDTDPATGLAWTATGVNNLLIGQKVQA
jgi:hypothetical protein